MSRAQPDTIFVHNDHDRPVVYALDVQGREHAQITLTNAPATDIEDIAIGPCGAGNCIYLSDTGDNNAVRAEYAVLRFAEPSVPGSVGQMSMTATYERFRFTYEDGSHNAEGLMVAPDGTIYVLTKLAPGSGGRVVANGPSSIYRLPSALSTDAVQRATKVVTQPADDGRPRGVWRSRAPLRSGLSAAHVRPLVRVLDAGGHAVRSGLQRYLAWIAGCTAEGCDGLAGLCDHQPNSAKFPDIACSGPLGRERERRALPTSPHWARIAACMSEPHPQGWPCSATPLG